MVPTLNNLPLVNDINDVSVLNGAETVCNRDRGATFRNAVEGFLDDFLGG